MVRSTVVAGLRVGLGGCGGLLPQLGGEELVPGPAADGVSRRWQQSAVADCPGARYPNGADGIDPEDEALLADSIGPALLVILHTLAPAERLAFVLHDMFAVPFDDIAPIVGRSPAAARQLASRGRRRVQGVAPVSGTDLTRQRAIVGAFLTAARNGDFDALLEALDPDIVVRSNGAEAVRGAAAVAGRAFPFTRIAQVTLPALINGAAGVVTAADGRPITLVAFTITGAKIVAIDLIDDPRRIAEADLAILGR